METPIVVITYFMGFLMSFLVGYQSINKRWLTIGNMPTYPRYLTSQRLYHVGVIGYALVSGLFFIAVTVYWVPLQPLLSLVLGQMNLGTDAINRITAEEALAPILAVALVIYLIRWNSPYNPLLIVQNAAYDFAAIPRKAYEVHSTIQNSQFFEKYQNRAEEIIAELNVENSLDKGDFEKNQKSLEFRWANVCMLYFEVDNFAKDSSYRRFFAEKSLNWPQIQSEHVHLSEEVARWKKAEPDYINSIQLIQQLEKIQDQLFWFLTFLHIFGSNSEEALWEKIDQYSTKTSETRLLSPSKEIAAVGIGIAFATLGGHELGILFCKCFLSNSAEIPQFFSFEALKWLPFAMCAVWGPVAINTLIRCKLVRTFPPGEREYWGMYIAMFLLTFILSLCAFVMVDFVMMYFRDTQMEVYLLKDRFKVFARWSIFPALIGSYCLYCIDRHRLLEKNKSIKLKLTGSIQRALLFGIAGSFLGLFATATFSSSALRITVITTLFLIMAGIAFILNYDSKRKEFQFSEVSE